MKIRYALRHRAEPPSGPRADTDQEQAWRRCRHGSTASS